MTITIAADLLTGATADDAKVAPPLRTATHPSSPHVRTITAAGHIPVPLPEIPDEHFNRTVDQRLADGKIFDEFFKSHGVDLLFDVETSAMTFAPDPSNASNTLAMTHALHGIPYVAHYMDPVTETMQQIDWPLRWRLLEHPAWIKWVWDDAHAQELIRLGATNVLSMPLGATDFDYPTEPLPERPTEAAVGFVGHPATSWFKAPSFKPADMRIGLIAAAAKADDPNLSFHNIYFDLYGVAEPPHQNEPPIERARKSAAYFQTKFAYNVFLAVKQRDRFVQFLQNSLGEKFELIGDYWQDCHGLPHKRAVRGQRALIDLFRNTAICINLIKGNAETGLNLRQFEVTAAGGFLMTYHMPELPRLFEPGKECVTFNSERDLLDKIRHYLAHPAERIEIALAGQRRTLREHLYSHRFRELVSRLNLVAKTRT